MGELETKTEFVAPTPNYPQSALNKKANYETMIRAQQTNELAILRRKLTRVQSQINSADPTDTNLLEYNLNSDIELPLSEEEKGEWRQEQKAFGERATKHILNRQKAFAVIIGQCTQRLQDKLHDDGLWETINKNQKPLELYALIERVVMQQTGDEYPVCNLVENLLAVITLKQQNNQTNTQWYEKLNTRVDVSESVGVEFTNFTSLWDYCCVLRGWGDYETLTAAEQNTIRNDSKERLLAYLLIANSSNTTSHESIKNNLVEAFIAKRDEYPTTRSDAIALLNKYDEKKPTPTGASEGTAFAQKAKGKAKGKEKGDDKKPPSEPKQSKNDKKFFSDKECFVCGKTGHGAKSCPNRKKSKSDDDDDSSISSKSSKIGDLEKKLKSTSKQFTQLKGLIEALGEASSDDEDLSHFQFLHFLLSHHHVGMDQMHNEASFKQSKGKLTELNLRQVVLLDNQSTMSLFCNPRW